MKAFSLTLLTILLCMAIGASTLKCFICNSISDRECDHGEDNVNKKYLQDCNNITDEKVKAELPGLPVPTANYTLCRKMTTVVDFNVNKNLAGYRIKRTCGWDDSEVKYNDGCYYRAGLGGRITTCTCSKDECNGARSTLGNSIPIIMMSSLAYVAKTFWS